MLRIRKVLFPTDFSESAGRAWAHAAFLADGHGAKLYALSVLASPDDPTDQLAELELSDEEFAERMGLSEEEHELPLVTKELGAASAPEGILRYASEQDVDLIVMGTHGRRGARRLLMGSVAEEVMRRAECPVLTVRAEEAAPPHPVVRRVLVPVDFSDFTRAALAYAVELAQTYGARIDLLHVVKSAGSLAFDGVPLPPENPERAKDRAHEALADLAREEIDHEDVRVAVEVGHPAAGITDYAAEHETDLIVIPTHGRTGLKRFLLGSVAEKVVRRATCPVFTVRAFGKSLLDVSRGGEPQRAASQ